MSRSFLNPVVTPVTALATRARASPCSARCSSASRLAMSVPSFCSKRIPVGTRTFILPVGPSTPPAPSFTWIFTPDGTGITLFPIRDMALCVPLCFETYFAIFLPGFLPNLAQQLTTYAFFVRRASSHQSARLENNCNPQPRHRWTNPELPHIASRAGPRNALQIRNHAPAIGRVAQKHAQCLFALLVHYFVVRNKTLFLHDSRDFHVQL